MNGAVMKHVFSSVVLIGKYKSLDVAGSLLQVANFLRENGITVFIENESAHSTGLNGHFPSIAFAEIVDHANLAIVLGGDGTMLNAVRQLAGHNVPLVGINQGHLGFLTDIPLNKACAQLEKILLGEYTEEFRFMLDAQVVRNGETVFRDCAFNDVVINKGDLGRMIEFTVRVNGEFVYTQRSDGMIVTTPTGSTAYSLSANGPILHPAMEAIALVPLCPHALTARPVALPADVKVEIALLEPHEARVHYDGQAHYDAHEGDSIFITRSASQVRLLHPAGYSYFSMLRKKLNWTSAPKNS